MVQYIIKILLSATILVTVSEISKRSSLAASILASLPLVSLLAIIWLYIDTRDIQKISNLSTGIFWLVIPSLLFFMLLPALLKRQVNFWLSMGLSTLIMVLFYFLMIFVLKKAGIKI